MRVPGLLQSRRAEIREGHNLDLRSGRLIRAGGGGGGGGVGMLADAIRLRPAVRTSLVIAILALAALLPAIRVADAQATMVLVSTIGQASNGTFALGSTEVAQGFTTGDNTDGLRPDQHRRVVRYFPGQPDREVTDRAAGHPRRGHDAVQPSHTGPGDQHVHATGLDRVVG